MPLSGYARLKKPAIKLIEEVSTNKNNTGITGEMHPYTFFIETLLPENKM